MNTTLQSGQPTQSAHLDADQLNAFAEGALPEHERTAALAHLAECARCREVAFLAQPPEPSPNVLPAAQPSGWRSWFAGSPLLGAATGGLVCALLLAGVVHFRYMLAPDATPPTAPAQVAEQSTPQLPAPMQMAAPPATVAAPAAKVSPASPPAVKTPASVAPMRSDAITPRAMGGIGAAAPMPPAGQSTIAGKALAPSKSQPAAPISVAAAMLAPPPAPVRQQPAAAGTVGRAEVARNTGTATLPGATNTDANNSAQFASTLDIESINALPAYDQLETHARQFQPSKALPSKLPVASQAVSGGRTLAVDSQGAVFLSMDGGRHWRAVRAPWTDKATQVTTAPATRQFAAKLPPPPTAAPAPATQTQDIANMGAAISQTASSSSQLPANLFQITTTAHEIWVSVDGVTWHRGP